MDDESWADLREKAENQQYLDVVQRKDVTLEMLDRLPQYDELKELEARLKGQGLLTFDRIFAQPTGYYAIKCFLEADYAADKAIFLKDVEAYKRIQFETARRSVAKLLYQRFVAYDNEPDKEMFDKGTSVFQILQAREGYGLGHDLHSTSDYKKDYSCRTSQHIAFQESVEKSYLGKSSQHEEPRPSIQYHEEKSVNSQSRHHTHNVSLPSSTASMPGSQSTSMESRESSLSIGSANNPIGVYGSSIRKVANKVVKGLAPKDLFDEVSQDVLADLRLDAFPRFKTSIQYQRYIRTKWMESQRVVITDFEPIRVLGRGGFGEVYACRKKNCGRIYAMKAINKKLVKQKNVLDNILEERNIFTMLKSRFVTNLKYALQDEDNLYFIMDLMLGGDLKFHLINAGHFPEERARFYTAEVLLGLEHMHQANILYRDVKLENILLDHNGHCRISDLGLAVVTKVKVKGYAGTPGYIAPEMVLNSLHGKTADFFSLGVMLYRMLCGKKPFMAKTERDINLATLHNKVVFSEVFSPSAISLLKGLLAKEPRDRLGANGIEEIKRHPFFDSIDWGLLEAGYVNPPFVPSKYDVNALSAKDIGHFDQSKFKNVKLDDRFKERLRNFEFVSSTALQEEMLAVLEKADQTKIFDTFPVHADAARRGAKTTKCCVLM